MRILMEEGKDEFWRFWVLFVIIILIFYVLIFLFISEEIIGILFNFFGV